MLIEVSFKSSLGFDYHEIVTELDRNYDDEPYALIFIDSQESRFGGYYEVNILKDDKGNLKEEDAYVNGFDFKEDTEPCETINDVKVKITYHDFDNIVKKCNDKLAQIGKRLVIDYDEKNKLFSVGIRNIFDLENVNDGSTEWLIIGASEAELLPSWISRRVNEVTELYKKKIWAVTYVGLNSKDDEANGDMGVIVCTTYQEARNTIKQITQEQLDYLANIDAIYKFIEKKDDNVRLSWNDGCNQMRIEIKELEKE